MEWKIFRITSVPRKISENETRRRINKEEEEEWKKKTGKTRSKKSRGGRKGSQEDEYHKTEGENKK